VVTIAEVRAFAITLPPSTEALVRGRVKFRIGRIVYRSLPGRNCRHGGSRPVYTPDVFGGRSPIQ
jgi:hypothetical protein